MFVYLNFSSASKSYQQVVVISIIVMFAVRVVVAAGEAAGSGCMSCHKGIESILQPESQMLEQVKEMGSNVGDPDGCVICHGGNPKASTKTEAHGGSFYSDPGSPWINNRTCGLCHREKLRAQWQSLMMTEAGKIQGVAWSAGALTGYEARWANYDVKNPSDPHKRLGTEAYRLYKEKLASIEPNAFPDHFTQVPKAPADPNDVVKNPENAAFTYIRLECQRCHLAVRGRQARGDYRGMGCSACHIPYGNEGLYEGGDPTIPRDKPGHLLVHTIQATRNARVKVHDKAYTGIPVETCTTCHDRGKRIGVSFQGLMESAYNSPWGDKGLPQPKLHTKHYLSMKGDVHNTKYGMICQDCHTSLDVHGDGFIAGTTLGSVEIECADCHGTPTRYPWELPLGYGDEFGRNLGGKPRGVTTKLLSFQDQFGMIYPVEDGYLLSARGNPFGNVVRHKDLVIVHTAGGKDLTLKPLKLLAETSTLPVEGRVAMGSISKHIDKLECYTCHAQWAPQCYGCHVKVDYSKKVTGYDWVAAGHVRKQQGHAADARDSDSSAMMIPGHVTETRSYLRWEDPAMGVNGEGRITPLIPGCQVNYTVVGKDGKDIIKNKIFRSPPGTEGGGDKGQLTIDMSPVQPHTNGAPRSCESCHLSKKAAGYGIGGGLLNGNWEKGRIVDLAAPDGTVLPENTRAQVEPIPGLTSDWSCIVTEQGKQLQTVGHHFKLSRPLDNSEREVLERQGICISCHLEIPKSSLAVNVLHHVAQMTGTIPKTASQHSDLLHKILLISAWGQVLLVIVVMISMFALGFALWKRKSRTQARRKPPALPGQK